MPCHYPHAECKYDAGERLAIRLVEEGKAWEEFSVEEQELWCQLFENHPHLAERSTSASLASAIPPPGGSSRYARRPSYITSQASVSDLSQLGTLPNSPTGLPHRALLNKQAQTMNAWAASRLSSGPAHRSGGFTSGPGPAPSPTLTPRPSTIRLPTMIGGQGIPTTPRGLAPAASRRAPSLERTASTVAPASPSPAPRPPPPHRLPTTHEESAGDDDSQDLDGLVIEFIEGRDRLNNLLLDAHAEESRIWDICARLHQMNWDGTAEAGVAGPSSPAAQSPTPAPAAGKRQRAHRGGKKKGKEEGQQWERELSAA